MNTMGKVIAGITTSVDGYITGPDDGPGRGLGMSGEALHWWVFGADVIRQALAAGQIDELTIIVAPIVLGAGKGLFDGFEKRVELEHLGVRQSPFATFIDYRVKRQLVGSPGVARAEPSAG
jgi:hypothetical protein